MSHDFLLVAMVSRVLVTRVGGVTVVPVSASDFRTHLLWEFEGFEKAWLQSMQNMESHMDPASDRMRRLSHEDVASSLDFESVLDVFEPFTAGMCEDEWCGEMQPERTIRWVDIRLSWFETRAG